MRIACVHLIIDPNAAALSQFQPCCFGKSGFRAHSDSEDDEITRVCRAGFGADHELPRFVRLESGNTVAQCHLNAVGLHVLLHRLSHFGVERRHHLVEHFHHRHRESPVGKVFRHFQSDKATAYNHGALGLFCVNPCAYVPAVRDAAHYKNAW